MSIQDQIDAMEACGGGQVIVPPGNYVSEGKIIVPSGIELLGSGPLSCFIGPIATRPNPSRTDGRKMFLRVEGFGVQGTGGGALAYIGVDFRETSYSEIRRLSVSGFQTAALLAGACFHNTVDHLFGDNIAIDGIEIYNGANQNLILNCKPSAPIAINIFNSNGTTIISGSGEGATPGNFIKQNDAGCVGTSVYGFRGETATFGPAWCNIPNLVGNF